MALNSYDAILAAITSGNGAESTYNKVPTFTTVAGSPYNLWWSGGYPVAGSYAGGSNGVNGATGTNTTTNAYFGDCTNDTSGALQLQFAPPTAASGLVPYITGVGAMGNVSLAGLIYVVDRMADCGQLTTTSGGTTSIAMPTSGVWKRSATGKGVMMWLESSSSAPAGATTFTIGYTGVKADGSTSAGTTGTMTLATTTHRVYSGGGAPFIALNAGHIGVAPGTITINTTAVSAISNVTLVVGKLLAVIPAANAYQYLERDLVLQTPRMPSLGVSSDDKTACIELLLMPGGAVSPTSISGSVATVVG